MITRAPIHLHDLRLDAGCRQRCRWRLENAAWWWSMAEQLRAVTERGYIASDAEAAYCEAMAHRHTVLAFGEAADEWSDPKALPETLEDWLRLADRLEDRSQSLSQSRHDRKRALSRQLEVYAQICRQLARELEAAA